MSDEDRISDISHWLCACINCKCPGEWGADPETALCWNIARLVIKLNDAQRAELATAILGNETVPKPDQ